MEKKYILDKIDFEKFMTAWKFANNSIERKSKLIVNNNFIPPIVMKQKGWLKAEHYMMYNIIKNKSIDSGFHNDKLIKQYKQNLLNTKGVYSNYPFDMLYKPFSSHMTKEEFSLIIDKILNKITTKIIY